MKTTKKKEKNPPVDNKSDREKNPTIDSRSEMNALNRMLQRQPDETLNASFSRLFQYT